MRTINVITTFNQTGDTHMNTKFASTGWLFRTLFLGLLLALAAPVMAQNARAITLETPITAQEARATAQFRAQFDTMMANYERIATKQGDLSTLEKASEARLALSRIPEQQLAILYSRAGYPDFSSAVIATELQASRPAKERVKSLPFPDAAAVISQCDSVDSSPGTRYVQLIAKEVTQAFIDSANYGCVETILGVNGSLACIPFAVANSIAQGFFNTSAFCDGEGSSNQIDASYRRLLHLHSDFGTGITSIINNDNSNTSSIISNDNTNKTAIITNDNTNTTTIVNNDNSNKTAIITNANTNTTNIITNDNANKVALITVANANTATIVNNDNANKAAIITNDNANTATLVAEIRALGCEIVRLLHTPDGQRASAALSCSAAPGFPYSWNKK